MGGEEGGFVIENRSSPAEDSRGAGANQRAGEGIEDGVGLGGFAGRKENEAGRGGEFADELVGVGERDIAYIVFEKEAGVGLEGAVTGDLDDVGFFAGDAGGEEVELAAFFDDEVEAEVLGRIEDGGFFGFVVEVVGTAWGCGHEDDAEAGG